MILPVCYSNPLAPRWRLPSFDFPKVNQRWEYAATFVVPAGGTVMNNVIPINGGTEFLWREVGFNIGAAAAGTIFARFKDGKGKKLSNDLLSVEELSGPLPINQSLPRATQLFVDLQNTGVGNISVQVILTGVQIYDRAGINTVVAGFEPEAYTPLYEMYSKPPAGWHDEPFDYYFEIPATALQTQTVVLPMEADADFYWRGSTAAYIGNGLQRFQFSDAWDNNLSFGYVFQTNEFGLAPQARPLGPPEVCCPAYSTVTVRAVEYANATTTAKIVLRGVKRYRD
jgi:hypothetical protein